MAKLTNVLIGIQARSTSTRLPAKCFEMIGDRMLLQHVVDRCKSAADYMNRYTYKTGCGVSVALLVPFGDPIAERFRNRALVIEGPENDVLGRYMKAVQQNNPDYIVRVTGDCPLIPSYIISKHIKLALGQEYDYVSNVSEDSRTSIDGHDCEVISRKLLEHLDQTAEPGPDREHVTTLARREPPDWARMGCVIGYFDHSGIKLSVDTQEDLERTRQEYDRVSKRVVAAERRYGKQSVHRV